MAQRILRSTTTATPSSLAEGQLAYSEDSGNLFVGTSGATVTKIGGITDVNKIAGIEAGAEVNTVDSVAGKTGVVTLVAADVSDFGTSVSTVIQATDITTLQNVTNTAPSNGQVLTYNSTSSEWEPAASGSGVTEFVSLNDTPATFTANAWAKVNAGGTALEWVTDIDDGTF